MLEQLILVGLLRGLPYLFGIKVPMLVEMWNHASCNASIPVNLSSGAVICNGLMNRSGVPLPAETKLGKQMASK